MEKQKGIIQFYLRLAIGVGYLVPAFDRLGVWGEHGGKNISWGDWHHFIKYAAETMRFFPSYLIEPLAIAATIGEIGFGLLLLLGKYTRIAALGSGMLSFFFAASMAISFGIVSPISYSVFVVSAASFYLATAKIYRWSFDEKFNSKEEAYANN
ncbi:MAG: DoxX family membrane protein [Chitinophagaceae bacterium]|nr:DoxX family membrane protein [Chitinophagaceae bacterium]